MSLIYGTESVFPANTLLTNGYTLYDWVMRKSCYPSFWGRSLTGKNAVTSDEIEFLKAKNCKVILIMRDLNEAVISSNNATDDAIKTVNAAKALNIPQNKGIVLFADIPSTWSVNHNWMIGFARILLSNGYIPGFIGNTDSSKNFNFGRQCSHYVQATKKEDQLHALYWATEPRYKFEPEIWAPYAPSELLPKDMDIWKYGTINFHNIHAGKCYIKDPAIMEHFI